MRKRLSACLALLAAGVFAGSACVSVKAPERINIQPHPAVADPSQVPPTASHEEARQRLAEAYAEIRYLRDKVYRLDNENERLEHERDRYKDMCDD